MARAAGHGTGTEIIFSKIMQPFCMLLFELRVLWSKTGRCEEKRTPWVDFVVARNLSAANRKRVFKIANPSVYFFSKITSPCESQVLRTSDRDIEGARRPSLAIQRRAGKDRSWREGTIT